MRLGQEREMYFLVLSWLLYLGSLLDHRAFSSKSLNKVTKNFLMMTSMIGSTLAFAISKTSPLISPYLHGQSVYSSLLQYHMQQRFSTRISLALQIIS